MTIKLSNVQFSYSGTAGRRVLDIDDWSVAPQEHVFLHGPSGCGKSTLLNLLSGLLVPSAGEVSVLGQRMDHLSGHQRDRFRANHIGYIFQQFNLISYLDPVDNIQLAHQFSKSGNKHQVRDDIESLLTTFNIPASDWHKPIAEFSMGQQQRIAIARALINKPELLIADEPTSSLDADNRDNFMSELMAMANAHNITLLFVSHDLSLSRHFERVDSMANINRVEG